MKRIDNFYALLEKKLSPMGIHLKQTSNFSVVETQGEVEVINRCKSGVPSESVKAHQWFDNVWLYMKIAFKSTPTDYVPFSSINVFYGDSQKLTSLLRAEWDNYDPKEGYNHPQPHWHITYQSANEPLSISNLNSDDEKSRAGRFSDLIDNKIERLNLGKMHLAMSGDWLTSGQMLTKYKDENQLVDWIVYLLNHLEEEIRYALDA